MSHKLNSDIAVIGIDIGKNSFHVVGCETAGQSCFGSGHAGRWKHGSPIYRRL
jgi:hypothetical protein